MGRPKPDVADQCDSVDEEGDLRRRLAHIAPQLAYDGARLLIRDHGVKDLGERLAEIADKFRVLGGVLHNGLHAHPLGFHGLTGKFENGVREFLYALNLPRELAAKGVLVVLPAYRHLDGKVREDAAVEVRDVQDFHPVRDTAAMQYLPDGAHVVFVAVARKLVQCNLELETAPEERGGIASRHVMLLQDNDFLAGLG